MGGGLALKAWSVCRSLFLTGVRGSQCQGGGGGEKGRDCQAGEASGDDDVHAGVAGRWSLAAGDGAGQGWAGHKWASSWEGGELLLHTSQAAKP